MGAQDLNLCGDAHALGGTAGRVGSLVHKHDHIATEIETYSLRLKGAIPALVHVGES